MTKLSAEKVSLFEEAEKDGNALITNFSFCDNVMAPVRLSPKKIRLLSKLPWLFSGISSR